MKKEDYIKTLDLFQVDKADYESYVYRLRHRDLLETKEENGLVMFWDIAAGEYVCGYKEETTIANNTTYKDYFIFELLPEECLASEKIIQKVVLSPEEYVAWLKLCNQVMNGKKGDNDDGEENLSTTC